MMRSVTIVVGVFVLVAVARGEPPVGRTNDGHSQRTPAASIGPVPKLAIIPFVNRGGDKEDDAFGYGVSAELMTRLVNLPQFELVDPTLSEEAGEERDFNADEEVKKAVELGEKLGAERILIGSYLPDADQMTIQGSVVDVGSGIVLHAARWQGDRAKRLDGLTTFALAVVDSFDKQVAMVDGQPTVTSAPVSARIVLTDAQRKWIEARGTLVDAAWESFSKGVAAKSAEEEIRWYSDAIRLDPDFTWAYHCRGCAYDDKGEYERAIADFNQAIKLKPDYASPYFGRGVACYFKQDYGRAIADFDQALKLRPHYAKAYSGRGLACANQGDIDRALADFDRAISLKPDYADAYLGRGTAYFAKRDCERAIADFDQVIKLSPDRADAYGGRGMAYAAKQDYDRALADFDQMIKLKPDYADAYSVRGFMYDSLKNYERALADFDQVIQLRPDSADAYCMRGLTYEHMENYDHAIADFDRALKLNPNHTAAHYYRGLALKAKQEYARAAVDFDEAARLGNPDASAEAAECRRRAAEGR